MTVADIENAEIEITKQAQAESYPEEMTSLIDGYIISPKRQLLPLRPICVNGILRVGGRTEKNRCCIW